MQPKKTLNITPLHLIIGGIITLAIIISAISIYKLTSPKTTTSIKNFPSTVKKDTDSSVEEKISQAIYDTISSFNSTGLSSIPTSGAVVRESTLSYQYDPDTDIYSGSFIVDIDKIRQSYLVQFEWSEDPDNANLSGYQTIVTCPPSEYIIYPEFECRDFLTESDSNNTLDSILPYRFINKYSVYQEPDNSSIIRIDIYACMDKVADPIEVAAREWVAENIPDLSNYTVQVYFCQDQPRQ